MHVKVQQLEAPVRVVKQKRSRLKRQSALSSRSATAKSANQRCQAEAQPLEAPTSAAQAISLPPEAPASATQIEVQLLALLKQNRYRQKRQLALLMQKCSC